MKETIGRLKVYFFCFGTLGLFVTFQSFLWLENRYRPSSQGLPDTLRETSLAILTFCDLSQAVVYLAFLVIAFQLRRLLLEKESLVTRTIWFSIAVSAVSLGAGLIYMPVPLALLMFLCGLAIKVPLLGQVNRVGAQVRAGNTPAPAV